MMICTFDSYSGMPRALLFGKMQQLHAQMAEEIGDDSDAKELYTDLLSSAVRYAVIRAAWLLQGREERIEADGAGSSAHDAVIRHMSILARYLHGTGKVAAWQEELGDGTGSPYGRKAVGDFACYLAFVGALNMR